MPKSLSAKTGGVTGSPNEEEEEEFWENIPIEQPFAKINKTSSGRTIHPRKFYKDEYQGIFTDRSTNYYDVLEDRNNGDDEALYSSTIIE